ncbi:MAG: hypothetical protein Q8K99_05385 [Actinomycetota bacterium]|nr:hypothetical protein [Actinomycetota bacterium]
MLVREGVNPRHGSLLTIAVTLQFCMLACILVACGPRSIETSHAPDALLATAVENMLDTSGMEFLLEKHSAYDSGQARGTMRGSDFEIGLERFIAAERGETSRLRVVDEEAYAQLSDGSTWVHFGTIGTQELAALQLYSPQAYIALLKDRTGVADHGLETTGGVECRQLQLDIPEGDYRAIVVAGDRSDAPGRWVVVNVWIGTRDSLIHRLQFTMADENPAVWVYEFSDFGTDVTIEVPESAIEASSDGVH